MTTITQKIEDAWEEEGKLRRLRLRPAPSAIIQAALIPPGGDWECRATSGAITRSIFWRDLEAALINPTGALGDAAEGGIAMGMCAAPVMDRALRVITILARDPGNSVLIGDIARAAIAYAERPAPAIPDPDEGEDD